MTDKRYKAGIWITVAYAVMLGAFAYLKREQMSNMDPNEWGDFLAGAASPLAFLWLVLGYLQQGEELKQNTEALNLQVKELQASVDQQRALVETTQRQHEFEVRREEVQRRSIFLQKQPIFNFELDFSSSDGAIDEWTIKLTNVGHRCANLRVEAVDGVTDDEVLSAFNQGEGNWWRAQISRGTGRLEIVIKYLDGSGEPQTQTAVAHANFDHNGMLIDVFPEDPRQHFPWETPAT